MRLYQEIILLQKWFKGKFVVENVNPYYNALIRPTVILHRHCFWSNFEVPTKEFKKLRTCKIKNEREVLQEEFGFNLDKYTNIDKRQILRNCVVPELGLYIFKCAFKEKQRRIGDYE